MKKTAFALLFSLLLITTTSLSGCYRESDPSLLNVEKDFSVSESLETVSGKAARVILLFGQSNATGLASKTIYETEYPADYSEISDTISDVYINFITENGCNSSNMAFVPCSFSCGASVDYFGPEVGIAYEYRKAYPDDAVFIIKYSYGGTMLHDQWLDGHKNRGELYTAALNFTRASLAYLKNCGYNVHMEGICWMQGENDACFLSCTENYGANASALISYFRKDLSDYGRNIRFADAEISEVWTYQKRVNKAKRTTALTTLNSVCLGTQKMGLTTNTEPSGNPDIAHYDSESMIKLGKAFADALLN